MLVKVASRLLLTLGLCNIQVPGVNHVQWGLQWPPDLGCLSSLEARFGPVGAGYTRSGTVVAADGLLNRSMAMGAVYVAKDNHPPCIEYHLSHLYILCILALPCTVTLHAWPMGSWGRDSLVTGSGAPS
jgi:hypothetical protein